MDWITTDLLLYAKHFCLNAAECRRGNIVTVIKP
jgi:hypothetical protein